MKERQGVSAAKRLAFSPGFIVNGFTSGQLHIHPCFGASSGTPRLFRAGAFLWQRANAVDGAFGDAGDHGVRWCDACAARQSEAVAVRSETGDRVALVLCWLVPMAVVVLVIWLAALMRDSTVRVAESLNPDRDISHDTRDGANGSLLLNRAAPAEPSRIAEPHSASAE